MLLYPTMQRITPYIVAAVLLGLVATADARPRPTRRASTFTANKTFGLGIMLGAPTGLSGKYFVGRSTAIDFGIGGNGYGYGRGRSGLHLHADYLWHPVVLASPPEFELPLYVGIGGRFFSYDWAHGDHYHTGAAVGVRAPIGISFDLNRTPLDIFVELALVGDLLIDRDDRVDGFDHNDGFYFDVNAAVGIRYYFN